MYMREVITMQGGFKSIDHNAPYFVTKTMKCSFTLKDERRLRMFENMVLRRIFGPTTNEVTGMEKTA
jgi:hypothetical protein